MKKNKNNSIEKVMKEFEITQADIKDGLCNYSFKVTDGVHVGDFHSVKGNGMVLDDMTDAFRRLNVHLAIIDDVFKHSKIKIDSIAKMHNHELTALYMVTGFKISGVSENESVIFKGTKYVQNGGHIDLVTPKITLDKLSSYEFHEELNSALMAARTEVEDYKEGKFIPVSPEDYENPKQMKITDQISDAEMEAAKI